MTEISLQKSIQYLKGIGPQRASLLAKLGIFTLQQLLEYYPRRYEDRSQIQFVQQLHHGELQTIAGRIVSSSEVKPRRGLTITKIGVVDATGVAYGVWFNQPYIKNQYKQGMEVILSGRVEKRQREIQILDPEIEPKDNGEAVHVARIVPIYPGTENLSQRVLRTIVKQVLDQGIGQISDPLPDWIKQKHGLMDKPLSVSNIHFPIDDISLAQAKRRLVYEELFILQLGLLLLKQRNQEDEPGVKHGCDGELTKSFFRNLPFALTGDQVKVIGEISADMEAERVMNRLVQGDVGSGKTIVAAAALIKTVENGFQGAMMAPTEILAEQHYCSLAELLTPLGVHVVLLTGSQSQKMRGNVLEQLSTGAAQIIVGTHALIQSEVVFSRLGLVVTDEQHRFGVRQRALLQQKGYRPDVLVMTATPIPRTLSLTLYGDLDYSVIKEMPPGRQPIETYVVTTNFRPRIYRFIRKLVDEGRQVYMVCPMIEESDKLQAEAVIQMAERLTHEVFPDLVVGLLHGKMKSADKEEIMNRFVNNEIHLLVATTVIEVGVNVPNATLMVIEGAERFGLAQLHQLRGRVGRGTHKSYCILISDCETEDCIERLQSLKDTTDGFVLAEKDLELRGPGELFGTRQHGLPDLKLANLLQDYNILEIARHDAKELIALGNPLPESLKRVLQERFTGDNQLIFIG
jgi:ATP-dependent DNA helicase RecG